MAVPGSVVGVGKLITPGGQQGPKGDAGTAANVPLADITQNGLLRQTSGNITDFVDGTNNYRALSGFITKTAAYTLTTADSNKYVICSGGSWTLTLPAAVSGLTYRVRNDMGISGTTGTITIARTGAATIDGQTSLALLPQQECILITDGTNWRTHELKREVILGTQDITSSTAAGTVLLPIGYRYFELEFTGLLPVSNPASFSAQLSTDGGSTWLATSYYHSALYNSSATAAAYLQVENGSSFYISVNNGGGSQLLPAQSRLVIYPGSATSYPTWRMTSWGRQTTNTDNKFDGGGGIIATPVNALKYFASAGNILNSFLTVKGVV
jgi:hypothetical protein